MDGHDPVMEQRHAQRRDMVRRQRRRERDFALSAARKRVRWMDALAETAALVSGSPIEGEAAQRRILSLCRLRDILGRDIFPDLRHSEGEHRVRMDLALSVALARLAMDEDLDEARAHQLAPMLHEWLSFAVECLPRGLSGDSDPVRVVTEIRLSCLADAMRFASLCERHAADWPDTVAPPDQWLLMTATEMTMEALGVQDVEGAAGASAEVSVLLRSCGQAVLDAAFELSFEEAGVSVGAAVEAGPPSADSEYPGLREFPRLRRALDSAPGGYSENSDPSRSLVMERVEDCVLEALPEGLAMPAPWEPLRGLGLALHRKLDRALADAWSMAMAEGVRLAVAEGRRLPALQPALNALREACGTAGTCAIEPDAVRARSWERAQRVEGLVRLILSTDGGYR